MASIGGTAAAERWSARKAGFHKLGIANIAMHKGQVRGWHTIEILALAGIRERIQKQSYGTCGWFTRHPVHEVRADEPCATGYQNVLRREWWVGCRDVCWVGG